MDLMEFKARELFEQAGLPVMKGVTGDTVEELVENVKNNTSLSFPLVCKAQVQVGGRGKAGGIKMANDMSELKTVAGQILGMDIKGHIVKKLMAVEKADVDREFYISIMLDRLTKCPLIIFSTQGGMDIEEVSKTTPELIHKIPVNPLKGLTDDISDKLVSFAALTGETADDFKSVLNKLYAFFMATDCLLAEINPLCVSKTGKIIALDGKVSVDDSAIYRQPEVEAFKKSLEKDENILIKEARDWNFLYIPCDPKCTIAVTSNGSGMLMSCMDRIHDNGMSVYGGKGEAG